jgi:hypothetical protein
MNRRSRVRAPRGPLRTTALAAALLSGAVLILASCSSGASSPPSSSGAHAPGGAALPAAPGAASAPNAAPASGGGPAAAPASGAANGPSSSSAQLAASGTSIIYTASLTVQAKSVTVAAAKATRTALSNGGYVSNENASINPGGHATPTISLQLKIPVAAYPAVLQILSTGLGTETALTQQAQDVTEQVADTGSRVLSAQAAIAQLRALLTRAGSVSDLLTVQDQINSEESTLEDLEAEQRALDDQITYATVSVTLVTPHRKTAVRPPAHHQNGFLAGLSTGWRGLRATVSAVLTAVGTVLPFAAAVTILVGAVYASRRRLARLVRRRSRPRAAE